MQNGPIPFSFKKEDPDQRSRIIAFIEGHSENSITDSCDHFCEDNEESTLITNILDFNEVVDTIDIIFEILSKKGKVFNSISCTVQFSFNLYKIISSYEPEILLTSRVLYIFLNLWKYMHMNSILFIPNEIIELIYQLLPYFMENGVESLHIIGSSIYYIWKNLDIVLFSEVLFDKYIIKALLTEKEENLLSVIKFYNLKSNNFCNSEIIEQVFNAIPNCFYSTNDTLCKSGLKFIKKYFGEDVVNRTQLIEALVKKLQFGSNLCLKYFSRFIINNFDLAIYIFSSELIGNSINFFIEEIDIFIPYENKEIAELILLIFIYDSNSIDLHILFRAIEQNIACNYFIKQNTVEFLCELLSLMDESQIIAFYQKNILDLLIDLIISSVNNQEIDLIIRKIISFSNEALNDINDISIFKLIEEAELHDLLDFINEQLVLNQIEADV